MLDGVTHRFVDVRGTRIHVAEAGAGPPLLLLHGWPQHWWCWRYLMGPLAETHRVIAPTCAAGPVSRSGRQLREADVRRQTCSVCSTPKASTR